MEGNYWTLCVIEREAADWLLLSLFVDYSGLFVDYSGLTTEHIILAFPVISFLFLCFLNLYCGLNKTYVWIQTWSWSVNFLVCVLLVFRDQDLAEALDSSSSDMEMEKGMVQVQEQSAQHRAKMWKVIRKIIHRSWFIWYVNEWEISWGRKWFHTFSFVRHNGTDWKD